MAESFLLLTKIAYDYYLIMMYYQGDSINIIYSHYFCSVHLWLLRSHDYNITHSYLYRYICMIHWLLLYNYIAEYDFATSLPPTLDILIPTIFDKC